MKEPAQEIELLEKARQGDAASRDCLYRQYFVENPWARALVVQEIRNPEDCTDLLRRAFLFLLRAESGGDSPLQNSVDRAIRIAILEKIRRDRTRKDETIRLTRQSREDYQFEELEAGAAPERLFSLLPEPLRTAFRLRLSEEMSFEEIATATQAPVNTVTARIFNAREYLAGSLAHQDAGCRNPELFDLTPGRSAEGLNSSEEVRHEVLWDLASARAGTPELKAHVDCCPACTALIATFSPLHAALGRSEPGTLAVCPTAAGLFAFSAHELSVADGGEISRHLESCLACRDELRWIEGAGPDQAKPFPRRQLLAWGAAAVLILTASFAALRHRAAPKSPYADLAQFPEPDRSDLVRSLGLPERFRPQLEKALAAYQAGNYPAAEASATTILTVLPSDPSALFVMALAAHRRGDPGAARQFMTQSERSQPMTGYRCWAALQFALLQGDRPAVDRECDHLRAYPGYAQRAANILAEVRRRSG